MLTRVSKLEYGSSRVSKVCMEQVGFAYAWFLLDEHNGRMMEQDGGHEVNC